MLADVRDHTEHLSRRELLVVTPLAGASLLVSRRRRRPGSFAIANQMWFFEARTVAAIARYELALDEDPTDPVVAFQLARAKWSFDELAHARELIRRAEDNDHRLSDGGRRVVQSYKERFSADPERGFPDWPPAHLDRDWIEDNRPTDGWDWITIADAADVRDIWGVAAFACDHWDGPIDPDRARDYDRIMTSRDMHYNMLAQMYA